jgi:hypothetical protein
MLPILFGESGRREERAELVCFGLFDRLRAQFRCEIDEIVY